MSSYLKQLFSGMFASSTNNQKEEDTSFMPTDSRVPMSLPPLRTRGPSRLSDSGTFNLTPPKTPSRLSKNVQTQVRTNTPVCITIDLDDESPSPSTPPQKIAIGSLNPPGAPITQKKVAARPSKPIPFPDLNRVANPIPTRKPRLSDEELLDMLKTENPPLREASIPPVVEAKKPEKVTSANIRVKGFPPLRNVQPRDVTEPKKEESVSSSSTSSSQPQVKKSYPPLKPKTQIAPAGPMRFRQIAQYEERRFVVNRIKHVIRCEGCTRGSVLVAWEPVRVPMNVVESFKKEGYKFTFASAGEDQYTVWWEDTWEPYSVLEEDMKYDLVDFWTTKQKQHVTKVEPLRGMRSSLQEMRQVCECSSHVKNAARWYSYQ